MAVQPDEVRSALRQIIDPCSVGLGRPVDIVTLGVVDDIVVNGGDVLVKLLLTDPACFFLGDFRRYITDVVSGLDEVSSVRVDLVDDRVWMPTVVHRDLVEEIELRQGAGRI
jgi:metal-sulfur cluster biosynthetic enzyme